MHVSNRIGFTSAQLHCFAVTLQVGKNICKRYNFKANFCMFVQMFHTFDERDFEIELV